MIHLINSDNRHQYSNLIDKMFSHRAQVFVDRLSWDLELKDGKEIDEFDTDDTIYLILVDDNSGKIKSSVRLNPTNKNHLMSEYFSNYCENGVPSSNDIWEISRYCYNPESIKPRDRVKVFFETLCGIMECALLYGWVKLTFVTGMALAPHCIGCGWDILPLGVPKKYNRETICAFEVRVSIGGLLALRKNASMVAPSLRILPFNYSISAEV